MNPAIIVAMLAALATKEDEPEVEQPETEQPEGGEEDGGL